MYNGRAANPTMRFIRRETGFGVVAVDRSRQHVIRQVKMFGMMRQGAQRRQRGVVRPNFGTLRIRAAGKPQKSWIFGWRRKMWC